METTSPWQVQTPVLALEPWQLLELCPDPAMDRVKKLTRKAAEHDIPVVIFGETGAGKEIVAGAIHQLSPRGKHQFEVLDCTNVNPHLMGSELFGHERGSFTGADQRHIGQFELADGGTILLDEIGELPPDLQCRILRVLENKSFKRVGGAEMVHSDFRLIAATNRNLAEMVEKKTFRQDLFYRLEVFPIVVPPLRQRPLDIMYFAHSFARGFLNGGEREISFAPESENWLLKQTWPGNVRQLRNAVERAMVLVNGDEIICLDHLDQSVAETRPAEIKPSQPPAVETCPADTGPDPRQVTSARAEDFSESRIIASVAELTDRVAWPELFERIEKAVIARRVERSKFLGQVHKELGICHTTLEKKRKKYGLPIGGYARAVGARVKLY